MVNFIQNLLILVLKFIFSHKKELLPLLFHEDLYLNLVFGMFGNEKGYWCIPCHLISPYPLIHSFWMKLQCMFQDSTFHQQLQEYLDQQSINPSPIYQPYFIIQVELLITNKYLENPHILLFIQKHSYYLYIPKTKLT